MHQGAVAEQAPVIELDLKHSLCRPQPDSIATVLGELDPRNGRAKE